MPFCGTKYTLLREAFNVGKISSKSSSVGSDGRTRIIRGILVRIFLRRSCVEGRVIRYRIKGKPRRASHFIHLHAQVTNLAQSTLINSLLLSDVFSRAPLSRSSFTNNLATDGWVVFSLSHGDQFSIGSAQVVVTPPPSSCYKLGVRFQSDDMVRRFLASGRPGFYLAVMREGEVVAGDEIKAIARDPN